MDWNAIGNSFFRMETRSWSQVAASPRLDRRHYTEQERIYTDWLASLRPAGVVAPNLTIACVLSLAGVAMTWVLPRKWTWLMVLLTLGWIARGFTLSQKADATAEEVRERAATEVEPAGRPA